MEEEKEYLTVKDVMQDLKIKNSYCKRKSQLSLDFPTDVR